MKITQNFTTCGRWGITLLFIGPFVGGVAYWMMWSSILARQPVDPIPYLAVVFVGVFASLAALPMMIIGRDFDGHIKPADNGMWK